MSKSAVDVLVFDSGVGGLSILQSIRKKAPGLTYAYLADNAMLPYGEKSAAWLEQRVPEIIAKLLERVECKVLVIACNTASTIALPPLRARFQCPVIGVIPAIKPAALLSQSKVIGLLATPGTVARPYTDKLIEDFAPDCKVVKLGNSRLVTMAEEALRGAELPLEEIRDITAPLRESGPDIVVLGCTHFPLMKSELEKVLPGVRLIDSGEAIANRVLHFNLPEKDGIVRTGKAYFTKDDVGGMNLAPFGIDSIEILI